MIKSNRTTLEKGPDVNAIVEMFMWWNEAFRDAEGYIPQAFAEHYTDNASLTVNGQLRGSGLNALSKHYRALQREFDLIQMELPVIDEFACGDRAFVHCVTRAETKGQVVRQEAMAVANIAEGKITSLKVIGREMA